VNSEWILLIFPFVACVFAAGVNLGVWRRRKRRIAHRSLAHASLATCVTLIGCGLLYFAESREDAIWARFAVFLAVVPIQVVSARLGADVFRVGTGAWLRLAWLPGAACALLGFVPGAFYESGQVARSVAWLGIAFVDVELTSLGQVLPLALNVPTLLQLRFVARHSPRVPDRFGLLGFSTLSIAVAASDSLMLCGFVDAPFLFPLAHSASCLAFTTLLMRHFVAELSEVEASAERFQRAAEARARELRAADLRLAHGAKLAALGTLAASLAHEINNPAAFVRSNLNYLENLAARGDDDPELEEVLEQTEEGVERLRGIVAELRHMSARGDSDFGEVALSEVVESALPTLRFEAREDVALEARLAPLPAVRGDRNLLGQVVANLVLNAIHAVRGSGRPGAVRIATFADDHRAVLEISDDGPGVPPELVERIFEPFFTTKPAGVGTGLGLAMTRQLVERHGGRLSLLPSERGARFQVELPLAPRPA
jgi:signal transduction histidine kinase